MTRILLIGSISDLLWEKSFVLKFNCITLCVRTITVCVHNDSLHSAIYSNYINIAYQYEAKINFYIFCYRKMKNINFPQILAAIIENKILSRVVPLLRAGHIRLLFRRYIGLQMAASTEEEPTIKRTHMALHLLLHCILCTCTCTCSKSHKKLMLKGAAWVTRLTHSSTAMCCV